MTIKTINIVKISKRVFKWTRCYKRGMYDKSLSDGFRFIRTYAGIIRHIHAYSDMIRHIQELFRNT